ncbi:MAG TPA: ANTAR domain-containing protein [Kribbella sp.]|nr:ANTAR domain-containing protein [Kribbella sp.]
MDESGSRSHQAPRAGHFERSVVPGPGLEITLDFAPQLLISSLAGHLRGAVRSQLRQTFRSALGQRPERVVVDTSELVTCDADGLTGLVEALSVTGMDDLPVAVTGLAPANRERLRVLAAGRQTPLIRTFSTLEDAVDELMAGPGAPDPELDVLLAEVRNLHRALLTRGQIDQAKGVLMALYGLDADAAFAMLVWYSRRTNLPLRELSMRFLAALRHDRADALTMARADELLADLTCRPPEAGGRHERQLRADGSAAG